MDLWTHGHIQIQNFIWLTYELMDSWVHKYMDLWAYEFMNTWTYGHMNLWTHGLILSA